MHGVNQWNVANIERLISIIASDSCHNFYVIIIIIIICINPNIFSKLYFWVSTERACNNCGIWLIAGLTYFIVKENCITLYLFSHRSFVVNLVNLFFKFLL